MESVHIHLVLNHIPILGSFFGLCLFTYGVLFKNISIKNAGLVTFIVVAILTIPAYLSGGGAEEQLEKMPGIHGSIIHDHEEIAEIAFLMMGILGIISLVMFVSFKKDSIKNYLTLIIIILSLITFITMTFVGLVGGKIQHTETYSKAKVSKFLDLKTPDSDDH